MVPDLDPARIAAGAVALVLGAVVQSAAGFGLGIVAIPLLTGAGAPLPHSVALVVGAASVQAALGLRSTRQELPWRDTLRVAAAQWICVPVGVWAMAAIAAADPVLVRQVVGAAVLVLTTAQLVVRPRPRSRLHGAWTAIAGGSAGLLAGAVGMGGPPIVLFAMAHDWSRDRFRAFLWRQLLLAAPVIVAVLALRFGREVLVLAACGLACAPLAWLGGSLGLAISRRWERREVLRAAAALLYVVGLNALLAPLL